MRQKDTVPATVLIVDDDFGIRQTLSDLLRECGYQVLCARNGAEAWSALERADVSPHAIVLDLMMPVMDGYEFRARQLADPRLNRIPVVVMTAQLDRDDGTLELDAPVLLKPFDVEDLQQRLHQLCVDRAARARSS